MRDDDLHLPEALCGALMGLLLLAAAFVSMPASAATAAPERGACADCTRSAR